MVSGVESSCTLQSLEWKTRLRRGNGTVQVAEEALTLSKGTLRGMLFTPDDCSNQDGKTRFWQSEVFPVFETRL
jgi:hypothetical protein